jgi:triosephosphate isomerase (TIM)
MRTSIIAGNWKMNTTVDDAIALVREMRNGLQAAKGVERVVCPPFVSLHAVAELLKPTDIGLGAQNLFWEEAGAYTGEIAPGMIAGICQYVIIGHSERREYFGETDEGVNKKVKSALSHNLTPIVCVGENLAQNEAGETEAFVGGQVWAAFAGLSAEEAEKIVVAYEPIWAIGTGKAATPAGAGALIGLTIRGTLANLYGEATAQAIRIQYGGSAKASNIADYMAHPDIDGALVGGASLKAAEFVEMVRIAGEVKLDR